ncbi:nucleoside hydrolase [Halobacillus sp. BBL2006]|uniref:nucleoside hydrolase n=1 Tax=Halobacillus sp. BBL2006 TaxID=1543706 RepID=UPI00068DC154|nr:nucleoside hydrolase [Halobacillus sp. BBL2006]
MITDPGVDDAFAIIYALLHPELDIVGIVCDYGNVSQPVAIRNTSYLLNLAGRGDIPIIRGSEVPLSGSAPKLFYDIHGYKGIGGVDTTGTPSPPLHPFHKIYQLIELHGSDLTIVNLSRLTSLAVAFIQSRSLIDKVKDIIIMGGAFFVPGNWTPLAEANIYGDAKAAKVVAKHGTNLTFIPLNVSNRAIISNSLIYSLSTQSHTPFSPILKTVMDYYSNKYKEIIPGINGAPLHDVTLLSYLTNKEDYQLISRQVFVIASGPAKGMTFADFRPVPEKVPNYPVNKMVLDFNFEKFQQDFVTILSAARFYH